MKKFDNASDSYTIAVIRKSIPDMEIVANRSRYISEDHFDNKIVTSVHWVSRL